VAFDKKPFYFFFATDEEAKYKLECLSLANLSARKAGVYLVEAPLRYPPSRVGSWLYLQTLVRV